ncbi:hypothetical protein JCM11641_002746 [Rhodosporidiobolus odoratus]
MVQSKQPATTTTQQSQASLAAPAWRQFSFFNSSPFTPSTSSPTSAPLHPSNLSVLHSNPTLGDIGVVLSADLDGRISLLNEKWEAERTWTAFQGGRVTWIETAGWDSRKGRVIVVTVGDDRSTPFPLLKLWLLTLPTSSPASAHLPPQDPHLTLLRSAPINPTPSRPSPASALALSPSLSHVVVGLADGYVVAWKHVDELAEASLNELEDAAARAAEPPAPNGKGRAEKLRPFTPGGMGKLRTLWEGNKEPVTNCGVTSDGTSPAGMQTLFILTTSQILSLHLPPSSHPLASKYRHAQPNVLDEHGAAVGCAKIVRLGVPGEDGDGRVQERMVVAREEAVYVYGGDGREGCWAYEGPKSAIVPLSTSFIAATSTLPPTSTPRLPTPYLLILTPPQTLSLSSKSATLRQAASSRLSGSTSSPNPGTTSDDRVGKVTMFDPENKFIAFSAPFGDAVGGGEAGVREVVEAWGAVWVLTESGRLFRLTEHPLQDSLQQLCQRNLFTLAVGLAQSRGLGSSEVAEINKRYGDHLYSKADYEGAMGCYLKTVGVVQASYVIRKFLDAQRLTHLTSYLQELHSRQLANTDITTLLLNCYTKLGDSAALEAFIHSSSSASSALDSSPRGAGEGPDEPPFDLETAIRVLRQAGYFSHASWLAGRYSLHGEYLRIAIEDEKDIPGALRYVRKLARGDKGNDGVEEAREGMRRWAGALLATEPELTTEVLVEICCGSLAQPDLKTGDEEKPAVNGSHSTTSTTTTAGQDAIKGRLADLRQRPAVGESSVSSRRSTAVPAYDVADTASPDVLFPSSSTSGVLAARTVSQQADLPSARLFFPHFVDHPQQFITFLEAVGERRYRKRVESLSFPPGGEELPEPHSSEDEAFAVSGEGEDDTRREEQILWDTLLELYISPSSSGDPEAQGEDEQRRGQQQDKALRLLRSRKEIPYDEIQALLICSAKGFEEGWVALCEMDGRYEDVIRYRIDGSLSSPDSSPASSRIISSLRRYTPSTPSLYPLVLRHLSSTPALLSRHQSDILDILDEVDETRAMQPVEVVRVLSEGGMAGLGALREYLKKQLGREKEETESDLALLSSYRNESLAKQKQVVELSDPDTPRVFQVTRCSACGGQLDVPMVHFMCKHSYHQRCLPENEAQCPNCAASHGVVRELARSNAALTGPGGHAQFLREIEERENGFRTVAGGFGRGVMGRREAA